MAKLRPKGAWLKRISTPSWSHLTSKFLPHSFSANIANNCSCICLLIWPYPIPYNHWTYNLAHAQKLWNEREVFFSHITAAGFSHTIYDTSFLLGESLSNVYRSMTTMHVRRRRRSAKAFLNHGRIVQHVQPALLVHVCKWHNHNISPSSAESLPRLLPLLITPPQSFQLLLSTLLPQHQCHDS